jgi:hypothetical protein
LLVVCHVCPAGVWVQIMTHGFRTVEEVIMEGDLKDEAAAKL